MSFWQVFNVFKDTEFGLFYNFSVWFLNFKCPTLIFFCKWDRYCLTHRIRSRRTIVSGVYPIILTTILRPFIAQVICSLRTLLTLILHHSYFGPYLVFAHGKVMFNKCVQNVVYPQFLQNSKMRQPRDFIRTLRVAKEESPHGEAPP